MLTQVYHKKHLVRSVASYYIFANLFNVWHRVKQLDIIYSTPNLLHYAFFFIELTLIIKIIQVSSV